MPINIKKLPLFILYQPLLYQKPCATYKINESAETSPQCKHFFAFEDTTSKFMQDTYVFD